MVKYLIAYGVTAAAFLVIDFVWLAKIAKNSTLTVLTA